MTDRSYSLSEIDEMRHKISNKYLYGAFQPVFSERGTSSYSYTEAEKATCVEQELRTYMLAGLGPDDLVDVDCSAIDADTTAIET